MYHFKNLTDVNLSYKRVLLRVALDVPLKNGRVVEDFRIREMLPTLAYLLKKNCAVVIVTWLGRPTGKPDQKYRLDPVARRLQQLIRRSVKKVDDTVGAAAREAIFDLQPGEILMLENTRFNPGELTNDPQFASALADGFALEVFDAFAQAHRVHASTTGLLDHLPAVSGYLLDKELAFLEGVFRAPDRPLVLAVGGAKVSDKIGLVASLIKKVDRVLIGGVCASVFLKAQSRAVGKSFLTDVFVNQAKRGSRQDSLAIARQLLRHYSHKIVLPVDMVAAPSITSRSTRVINIDRDTMDQRLAFYDIGPRTIKLFLRELRQAKTILWNGPMGVFEQKAFERGTAELVKAVAGSQAISIGGGGDTEEIIAKYKLAGKFSHVSTGGGAMLEFLSGKKLPALESLAQNQRTSRLWNFAPQPIVPFTAGNNPYYRYRFLNLKEILAPAAAHHFGVPACNVRSKYILDGILNAAFKEHSPVIIEIAESEMAYCGISPEHLAEMVLARLPKLEKKYGYRIPVTLHADHVRKDLTIIDRAVKAGFSSCLADQSSYPFTQNIRITKSVVRKLHSLGVSIEGEVGQIAAEVSREQQVTGLANVLKLAPSVSEAVAFVGQTGVDAFAGYFGNHHGKYAKPATIVWGHMKKISRALRRRGLAVPLVLHGTSHLTTETLNHIQVYHTAIKCGCAKFNYSTMLSDILRTHLPKSLDARMVKFAGGEAGWRKSLGAFAKEIDRLDTKILRAMTQDVEDHVRLMMREAWRSSGKAKYYRKILERTT
ncbi:phosphoglycerate kinase [Candidatus Falkowbacteria bacterium]|nr:phosphoglycerate kinase [Candidatus Falkowbacteria bacterium]